MRIARPRVLFVAPTLPAVTGNGLAMRMGVFAEALARWADVDLAVVPVAGGSVEITPFLQSLGLRMSPVSWDRRPDTHYALLSRIADPAARLQAFKAYGKPTLASALTARVAENIGQLAGGGRYDLVHIGRSYMLPLARFLPETTPMTLDLDEDDRASFASRAVLARRSGDCFLADWLDQEGQACDGMITAMVGRLRRAFAASVRECENLARRHPGVRFETVANAVEIPRRAPRIEDGRSILFVGSLGYEPNADSILWFARTIMPRLRTGFGRCRLTIAGARIGQASGHSRPWLCRRSRRSLSKGQSAGCPDAGGWRHAHQGARGGSFWRSHGCKPPGCGRTVYAAAALGMDLPASFGLRGGLRRCAF
jgi:hypothetical protein